MTKTKTINVAGVVLKASRYSEADHLIVLLTSELGKVTAIAKGARKSKGSMRGKTQPFTCGRYMLYRGRNLYTVTEAETITSFNELGNHVDKYGYASYVCELTDALLESDFPVPDIFALLLSVLHYIHISPDILIIPWYQLNLLKQLGYAPEVYNCVQCGQSLTEQPFFFNNITADFSCQDCAPNRQKVSGGAGAVIKKLLEIELAKLGRLKLSPHIISEVETITHQIMDKHLTRPLKSKAFLQCIKQ